MQKRAGKNLWKFEMGVKKYIIITYVSSHTPKRRTDSPVFFFSFVGNIQIDLKKVLHLFCHCWVLICLLSTNHKFLLILGSGWLSWMLGFYVLWLYLYHQQKQGYKGWLMIIKKRRQLRLEPWMRPKRRQIIIIDLAFSPSIYLSL